MTVGIDKLAFYSPHYFLDLRTLACGRGVDPEKYLRGLGQYKMAVLPPDETTVTLAANAAHLLLEGEDLSQISTVLFATESGVDHSKSAGVFVHQLLGLPSRCRVIELKQACYSGTGGLQLALGLLHQYPNQKVLLLAADIARYGLGSVGESSQGGGAVALLLSTHPRLLEIETESGLYTEDAMDFWRPNYREEAFVEGKYSCDLYLKALREVWQDYQSRTQRTYQDHQHFLYHTPFPRLAEKAHQKLASINGLRLDETMIQAGSEHALAYSRIVGNCYTASLYIGLASLLEQHPEDLSQHRIGFYSYGSGSVAEFFSGRVQTGYREHLFTKAHKEMLEKRTELSLAEYEAFYTYRTPIDGSEHILPQHRTGVFRLASLDQHKPQYRRIEAPESQFRKPVTAQAPGKLIVCGEHAVVHGSPAIAMAINRYAKTHITPHQAPESVQFNFLNIGHQAAYSFDKLRQLKHRLQSAHHKFLQGEKGIRDVIKKPFELLQYTAMNMLETLKPSNSDGFEITSDSNIPMGCGLGSSAASIVSTNFAIARFFGHPLESKKQFELSLAAENLQHGKSSGLDLHMSIHGGCLRFENGRALPRTWPSHFPLAMINTGQPSSSTGECVEQVANLFDEALLGRFNQVVNAIDAALIQGDLAEFMKGIRENHRLLLEIGVVPDRVQGLISALENAGAAAKICGAGAISGQKAGIVMLVSTTDLSSLIQSLGYELESVAVDLQGVRV